MDNRVFNVNGSGDEMLLKALELVFLQRSEKTTCSGWQQTKEDGLILCWTKNDESITPIPSDLTATECLPFVLSWLKGEFAKSVQLSKWCDNLDHDGHNSGGWQVYCDDWGRVGSQSYSICAIKPAYMWHGK